MTDKEMLDYLTQSEVIRLVVEGKYKPWELDSAYRNMKTRMREMEHTHILDTQAISNLTVALERLVSE